MKDIDFDELDKAVNSLMATAPITPEDAASNVKPETTLEVSVQPNPPANVPAASAPAATNPEVNEAEAPVALVTPPAAAVTPAVKRTGRFMDMVHASSDMTPRSVSAPRSREGLSITPRSESTAAAPAVSTVESSPAEPPMSPKTPEVMPDPIDLGNSLETPAAEPSSPVEPAASVTTESPFIADAKVEKRPLNAEASASSTSSLDTQLANELNDSDKTTDVPDGSSSDEPPVIPQVPELSSDLVAIESTEKVDEPVATQTTDTKEAANVVDAPAVPLGASSIAKQYKSQPSTGDQSHAAIYDASEYPEPVTHPAKKKSGWLWVLWVVLLLAVGAGAAALLYFLGIIP
jgi:hypothetical protein